LQLWAFALACVNCKCVWLCSFSHFFLSLEKSKSIFIVKELMATSIDNIFSKRIQIILSPPFRTLLLVSYAFSFIGFIFDIINNHNTNLSILFLPNIIAVALLTISFMFFIPKKINFQLTAAILTYVLVSNITVSNIILLLNEIPQWQLNFLRDIFIIACFIAVAGFILNTIHIIVINIIFSSFVLYAYILSEPCFVSKNALSLVLLMAGFSLGIFVFISRLRKSLKENQELNNLVIKRNKEVLQKEAALISEKALRLEETINYKNKELVSNAVIFAQNMEVKNKITKRLESEKTNIDPKLNTELVNLVSQLSTLDNNKHWTEFQKRFNDVHQDFYKNISEKFSSLSPAEQKLAGFIKLGMSSKEISLLTQNTTESVDVARSRLRKKMNLQKSDNLTSFLSKF
jgi:DNA-binding CsgD family transcriptional regulator